MISITLHDLRHRARQFLIAVVGASLVFAMALLLTGLAAGFGIEVHETVAGAGAAAWVMSPGTTGRITSLPPMPETTAQQAAAYLANNGVNGASLVVVSPAAAETAKGLASVVVVGYQPGHLGLPPLAAGRALARPSQAVVDVRLGVPLGGTFVLAGQRYLVTGLVVGRSLLGGFPDVYVTVGEAQRAVFGGRALVSAVLVPTYPDPRPPGLVVMSASQIESRSLGQMAQAVSSIQNSRLLMWFIAAVIVAALVYVAALERTRDFAVLKALGSSSLRLFGGLALQAVLVSLIAAALAAALAQFMTGVFQQPVDVPATAYVVLPVSALLVGLLASVVALRKAVAVDPALAFGGG